MGSKNGILRKKDEIQKIQVEAQGSHPKEGVVRVVMISDTHMEHNKLEMPPGDILIHSGDFTNTGTRDEIQEFDTWLGGLDMYKCKVVVPGNHDTGTDVTTVHKLEEQGKYDQWKEVTHINNAIVLNNEVKDIMGLNIFGCPFTMFQPGIPWWAYLANSEQDMESYLSGLVPGVDIVVTHGPPACIGDSNFEGTHCGSTSLRDRVKMVKPILHVFGHIHEGQGVYKDPSQDTLFVNASSLGHPLNKNLSKPVVVDINVNMKCIER